MATAPVRATRVFPQWPGFQYPQGGDQPLEVDGHEGGPTLVFMATHGSFASDIAAIRKRAREHLERGALTPNYGGDVETAIKLLNEAVATEIVCVLRYRFHAVCATGLASESVKAEFAEHAVEEEQHLLWLAERINQLGGKPDLNPAGVSTRAATQYVEGTDLVDMIRENLVAERIAIETYRDLIRYFAEKDPTTRALLEKVLAQEEEHANDMHDLLVAHEGRPMLDR
jgi:bacterioferritin